jgi:hypothetical protein
MAASSSCERTWSPAAAENAAPATNRAAKVVATAIRRRRERGFVLVAAATGGAGSSPSPCSSHSSQARPWRSLLIKEFRGGIAFAPFVGRRGRHFDADSDFEIRGPYGLT